VERRLAIIQLHADGWNVKSIADYLETSRFTVYDVLHRWAEEQFAGLPNKSSRPKQPATKQTLNAITTVKRLQENPELGEFRIYAALKQLGIELSPRTCGRILQANRALYGLPGPVKKPHTPKVMPYGAHKRHQCWSVDLRYIDVHHIDGDPVYCISILENYSRAILASALSRRQDLSAYLVVLYAALHQYGGPDALVSDNGSIFKDDRAKAIYAALGIEPSRLSTTSRGRTTSRRTSTSSGGWRTGTSPRRRAGSSSNTSTTAGSATSKSRRTGPTRNGATGGGARVRSSTGSSGRPVT